MFCQWVNPSINLLGHMQISVHEERIEERSADTDVMMCGRICIQLHDLDLKKEMLRRLESRDGRCFLLGAQ